MRTVLCNFFPLSLVHTSSVYLPCLSMKVSRSPEQISASLVCAFPGPALILFCIAIYESYQSTAQPQPWDCWRFYCSVSRCVFHYELTSPTFSFLDWNPSFPLRRKVLENTVDRHLLFCPFCTVSWSSNLCFPCSSLHVPSLMLQSSLGFQSQHSVQCNLITKELEHSEKRQNSWDLIICFYVWCLLWN